MSLRIAYWTAGIVFAALVAAKIHPTTGLTSLLRFGETWKSHRHPALASLPITTVPNSNGYDGQFYAQLAVDPLLREPETIQALDAPSYRARRIMLPAMAFVLGGGDPWWTINFYASLNVLAWFGLAWLVRKRVTNDWIGFSRWFGCLFGLGVLESVRQSLLDLPALFLVLLAAGHSGASLKSGLWLAFAGLTKETSLIATAAFGWSNNFRSSLELRRLTILAVSTIPLVLWSFYVERQLLGSTASTSGLGNFAWPLVGLFGHLEICVAQLAAGNWDGRYSMGLLAALGLAVQAWAIWRTPNISSILWRIGAAHSVLLLVIGPWVWSGYWAACRALLPLTVAFNLLLPTDSRRFWPLWIAGNLSLLHGIWRFL
jgi:hypothetical protein